MSFKGFCLKEVEIGNMHVKYLFLNVSRHKKSEGVLHIRGAKKSDEGKYVCQLITTTGDVIFQLHANLVVHGTI